MVKYFTGCCAIMIQPNYLLMKIQKINISFSRYSDADFLTKAEHIVTSMRENPAFTDPVPTLAEVQAAIALYAAALVAAEGLGRTNVAQKNKNRMALELSLGQLGMFVMFVANGDAATLTGSGYTLSKEPEPRYITNPGNVKLGNGVTSGELVASIKGATAGSGYLHEIAMELPTENTVWTSNANSRAKFTFKNLQPGKQYWVRVAVVASKGQLAYSPVASQYVQ